MNLLQQFVDFLLNEKPKRSLLTVKNYKADVRQFIAWLERESKYPFNPSLITPQILEQYKKNKDLSVSSIERHFSSLRKFFQFLKFKEFILYNPFERKTVCTGARALEDPWMIRNFKNFLYECKKSNFTIKNYINDVKSFFTWLEEVALTKYNWKLADKNLLAKINLTVLQEYKQRLIAALFSPATINRKLSSLRSYISWAKNQGLISEDPLRHPEFISGSPTRRQASSQSDEIPKPVRDDKETYSSFPLRRLMQKSLKGINFFFDNLFILPLAQTLEGMQYLFWKITGKNVFKKHVILSSPQDDITRVSNIKKGFYAPLEMSVRYFPLHKRIWHYLRHIRPNWYKRYHSYSFTHYLHFAILMALSCAAGLGIYDHLFVNTPKENAILGASTAAPRILSFQGKINDASEIPITKKTTVLFSLYNDENASSEASLWQENNTVRPDSNGSFSILLGKKNPISDTIFSQNSRLFLGITIDNSPELRPRQEIATVPFAGNAQTLQGLEPIINSNQVNNVILALDSSGNLNIAGEKTHVFQTIGGNLILSGKVLSLTTVPGTNSNIEIVPDGMGTIDLAKPIQNTSNNNNLISALGSVEFDDTVAILATTSGQAALQINQNSTGTLISASTNEIAKFTVENDGSGMFAGDLGINGGDLTSEATSFSLLNSTVTTLNLGGAATTLNIGVLGGTTFIKSNLTVDKDFILPSLSSNGGILYTNASGKISQTSAGSSSDCLTGGTNPAFTNCSNIFNQVTHVGIGTTNPLFKLDVQDSQDATAAAQIYNGSIYPKAAGLIVKLGNALPVSNMSSGSFINFETAGVGTVGAILRNGDGTGVSYATNGNADFAEYFKKNQDQIIEYGSIVCLNDTGLAVKCDNNNRKVIGVASEQPAFLGGQNLGNGSIAVGLTGQVETLVSTANGEIKAGDVLTASDIPGVAQKATNAGPIVGKALEGLASINEAKVVGYYDPDSQEYVSKAGFPNIPLKSNIVRIFKLPALVNVSWYDPDSYLAQNGELIISSTGSNEYSIANSKNEALANIGGFFEVLTAKLRAGLINASDVITNTLIVTSDSIIVNGQSLKDYIIKVIQESPLRQDFGGQAGIISSISDVDQLSANVISPLGESLIVRLSSPSAETSDSQFIIQNSSGSAVATVDSQGNARFAGDVEARRASFSGKLQTNELLTNQLTTSDASVSGTLRAGNILADSIEGLGAKVSSYVNLASYSAQFAYVPSLTAEQAQFNQGLMVFGATSLSDLSVAGNLSVGGTMFVTQNSLEVLGADLSLQSLKQGGLSMMGGLVYIDTQGNLRVQGDLSVTGNLAVNNVQGLNVLSVNQAGDVIASGSGTFTKLNFNLIQPVLAVSSTEVIASSSAGIANIAPYQSEITIKNPFVTSKSVIYITPVGTPSAQTPFLMRQIPKESFTVGVQSPTNHPLDFNWLIVN